MEHRLKLVLRKEEHNLGLSYTEEHEPKTTGKDQLSPDAKVMWVLMNQGVCTRKELDDAMGRVGVNSRTHRWRIIALLKSKGVIKQVGEGYALSTYTGDLRDEMQKALRTTFENATQVGLNDLANELGEPPTESFKAVAYPLAKTLGKKIGDVTIHKPSPIKTS